MKKEYKKPELLFDSFERNASIAGACEKNVGHSENDCKLGDNTFTLACDYQPQDGNPDGSCYHVFTLGFTS